ncbi:MAG: glutamine-hydrolyzing GMP synthase [Proteobacteria bacterium]|nr:glutamine-hydrolyzing GMP synthase [Pseudomonadota bacterium]
MTTLNKVLVVDFGGQSVQLIARRVREAGVFSEVMAFDKLTEERVRAFNPRAIILSGGPASVLEQNSPQLPMFMYEMGVPMLGICYGQQTMAAQLGGEVASGAGRGEYGAAKLDHYAPMMGRPEVWMSHGDHVSALPPGFALISSTSNCLYAMIYDDKRKFLGVQFHPEMTHTKDGAGLIRTFLFDLAGCEPDLTQASLLDEAVAMVQRTVGDTGRVLCAGSGGVDSAVLAGVLKRAIGPDRVVCVHVDHGMMRKGESDMVADIFTRHFNMPLHVVRAGDLFLDRIAGIADPEKKRRIIGAAFIEMFEAEAKKHGDLQYLGQGTIYPDVIESTSFFGGPSKVIKSHHNVGGLPPWMRMPLVEPLRHLFKDQVRALGRELGLPDWFVRRHPFPGPGLGIRVPGAVQRWQVQMLADADEIYLKAIEAVPGLYEQIAQAFAVFLPVMAVGKMGDNRVEGWGFMLRAVQTDDFMSVEPFDNWPKGFLKDVVKRICMDVVGPGGQRFVRGGYDYIGKPPGTTEWE